MQYYSQDGQDKFLDEKVFNKKTNGVFIEIGANDGITLSNCYFLEKNRGWTGICVEPHPKAFEKLQQNRTAKLINACIADVEKVSSYMKIDGYGEMYSGLVEKYDDKHVKRINNDLSIHGGSKQVIQVQCKRLDSIIRENNLMQVDYCSVDTEGGELDILETAGLTTNDIDVISVENNYYENEIVKFMKGFGYNRFAKVGADEFFRKRRRKFWLFDV